MKRWDNARRMVDTGILAMVGGFVLLSAPILGPCTALSASPETPSHLRLKDRLDRPQDGYCIDIPGTPRNLRLDVPLFVHNCKPRLTIDSAVVMTSDGRLKFPGVDRCLTVAGINSGALPGASILLRKCRESTPFFETSRLQRFTHRPDGALVLVGSKLCLAVGARSAVTYSASDRWRTLFVDDCATAQPARSRWEFVAPGR